MPDDPADLWTTLRAAATDPAVHADLVALYDQLDRAVAQRGPTCWASGECCRFDSYGHRLYVTALEIAWCLQQAAAAGVQADADAPPPAAQPSASSTPQGRGIALPQWPDVTTNQATDTTDTTALPDACPYQRDGLCSIHTIRPMGCRVFFCEAGTEPWQHDLYERFLVKLRGLHEQHALPYRYLEWRAGLIEAGQT